VFPHGRKANLWLLWPADEDAIGMAAKQSIGRSEAETFSRRETKTGADQVLARDFLVEMATGKNIACSRQMLRVTYPIVLNAT
jgi:hypothetical protein